MEHEGILGHGEINRLALERALDLSYDRYRRVTWRA
jgi:hypothetical protein